MASSDSSTPSNGTLTPHFFSKDRHPETHFLKSDHIPSATATATATADTHYIKADPKSTTIITSPVDVPPPLLLTPDPAAYTPATDSKKKLLKTRVAAGETLYGLFLMSASPTIAEILGLSGYDFVVVDMEHGPGGIADALSCVRALAAAGTPAVIRVPEKSAAWTKKALDLGPQGIMFPMVENAAMAAQVVSYCRYPPRGIRGTAHVMVRASGYGTDESYVERCEEELLIMCMVETETGVDNIEGIAGVDGVDAIQMGPRDLGASMGYLRDPANARVKEVLLGAEKRVLAMQKGRAGPYLGGISTAQHSPQAMRERGYNFVAGGVDIGLFKQAAVADVQKFRGGAVEAVAAKPPKNHKVANGVHVPSAA